jgi:hypothetical protein
MYYDFFFFLVMLYSNFVMNTLEKIPGAVIDYPICAYKSLQNSTPTLIYN